MAENNKMHSLQLIRAVAALTVLIYHATILNRQYHNYEYLNGIFSYGFFGVDLFFVLSGFIIFYIHHTDIQNPTRVVPFLKKRFIRIYPVYWIITLAMIPVYFVIPSFGEGYERNLDVIIKSLLLSPQNHDPILGVGWSLCYEIFFYALFSMLIVSKRMVAIPIMVAWIITTVYSVIWMSPEIWKSQHYLFQFFFNPINIEFLLGCFIAFCAIKYKPYKVSTYLIGIGSVWFLTSVLSEHFGIFHITRLDINRVLAYGLPSFFIVFGFVVRELTQKVRAPKLMTYLGDASYVIYLIHFPFMSFMNKLFTSMHVFDRIGHFIPISLCILITITVSCLFHSLIEKPLLKFARMQLFYQRKNVGRQTFDTTINK